MKNVRQEEQWGNQRLYAGLDIHSTKWVVTVRTQELQLKTFVVPPGKEVLLRTFRHLWPGAQIDAVYEAGCFGYHLADFLNAHGIKTIIVAPHTIPVPPGQFVKTDVIDSKKLALELSRGTLRGIYQRLPQDLYDRSLLRRRHRLVKRRIQVQHQLKADLRFFGIDSPDSMTPYWSKKCLADLKQLPFPSETFAQAFRLGVAEFEAIRQQIRSLDELLIAMSESDRFREPIVLLRSVPGVGRLAALTILLELGDIHRFRSADKFASYLGLTPSEYSSGEKTRRGSLTGMGNKSLRALLVQSAWAAIKKDPALLEKFQRISVGKSKCLAIVAVAKSLSARIRKVMMSKEPYVIGVAG